MLHKIGFLAMVLGGAAYVTGPGGFFKPAKQNLLGGGDALVAIGAGLALWYLAS